MSACTICEDRAIEFLYAELGEPEASAYQAHLSGSPGCAAALEALRATLLASRLEDTREPSPELLAGLKAEARKSVAEARAEREAEARARRREFASHPARATRRAPLVPRWLPLAASLVLALGAGWLLLRPGADPPPGAIAELRPPAAPAPQAVRRGEAGTASLQERSRDEVAPERKGKDVTEHLAAGSAPAPAPTAKLRDEAAPARPSEAIPFPVSPRRQPAAQEPARLREEVESGRAGQGEQEPGAPAAPARLDRGFQPFSEVATAERDLGSREDAFAKARPEPAPVAPEPPAPSALGAERDLAPSLGSLLADGRSGELADRYALERLSGSLPEDALPALLDQARAAARSPRPSVRTAALVLFLALGEERAPAVAIPALEAAETLARHLGLPEQARLARRRLEGRRGPAATPAAPR